MKIFVADISPGDYITDQVFAINEIQQHKTRTDKPYYNVRLVDSSGSIQGKVWENAFPQTNVTSLDVGAVVSVSGKVQEFQGKIQLVIDSMASTKNYNIADIQKISERDIDQMFTDIEEHTHSVENKSLKALLQNLFADEEFVNRLKRSPAAEKVHHDYIGGLLDHIHEMLDTTKGLLPHYPKADADLVFTGVVLHDIGKLWELETIGTTFNRSTEGYLISHIPLASEYLKGKLPDNFPEKLWMKLNHIILSHHDELEYGAVVRPQTIEASIVSVADKASSTVRQFQKALEESEGSDSEFTEYQKWIGVKVYKG